MLVVIPKPSWVVGSGVRPVVPIVAIKAAADGVLRFRRSSGSIDAASGVEVGCEDVLILCAWPWIEAGVFTAGDFPAKCLFAMDAVLGRLGVVLTWFFGVDPI